MRTLFSNLGSIYGAISLLSPHLADPYSLPCLYFFLFLPYADKNKGYFEVKEWIDPLGTLVGIQTLITPKGRHYLLILLDSEGFYDE